MRGKFPFRIRYLDGCHSASGGVTSLAHLDIAAEQGDVCLIDGGIRPKSGKVCLIDEGLGPNTAARRHFAGSLNAPSFKSGLCRNWVSLNSEHSLTG